MTSLRTSSEPLRLLVLLGSVTPPGRLRRALELSLGQTATDPALQTGLIDLAETHISFADGRAPEELGDDTAQVLNEVTAADALVIASPVYRGSLTGSLKNLLDHLPIESLEGKATGIVTMGATHHHYLGAERHLRDVLSFFGVALSPVALYLTSNDFYDGEPAEQVVRELDELFTTTIELALFLRERPSPTSLRPLLARHRSGASSVSGAKG